jgi:hypothetical protein
VSRELRLAGFAQSFRKLPANRCFETKIRRAERPAGLHRADHRTRERIVAFGRRGKPPARSFVSLPTEAIFS